MEKIFENITKAFNFKMNGIIALSKQENLNDYEKISIIKDAGMCKAQAAIVYHESGDDGLINKYLETMPIVTKRIGLEYSL